MKKLIVILNILLLVFFIGVCFSATEEKDLFKDIGRDQQGTGGGNWKMQVWLGKDGGSGEDPDMKLPKELKGKDANIIPFLLKGTGSTTGNRLVFWVMEGGGVHLKPKKKYTMKAWLKLQDVEGYVWLIAAIRGGGVEDVRGKKIFGTKDWAEYTVEFEVEEECIPAYFAIDLWGPGSVWIGPIKLIEK